MYFKTERKVLKNDLKKTFNGLYAKYHDPSYLRYDPLEFVHGLAGRENRELGGLLCACLAYGRVEQIRASIAKILMITGGDIFRFASENSLAEKTALFSNFKHRFNVGEDIALLFECGAKAMERFGSLEGAFCDGFDGSQPTIREGLNTFVARLRTLAGESGVKLSRSFVFMLPAPASGSACKRLVMYLRWMVRANDGIDLGLWHRVSPSKLVMPVDTHVAALSRSAGLTKRKSADWVMAEEITAVMRTLCPKDPAKYDFALCRTGMIDFRK
jgi:uncharacterized protein (TIGR02757 family)